MKQVFAKIISNKQILKEFKRRRDIVCPQPPDILGSWIIWLKCSEITPEAKPGQFVMVRSGKDNLLRRPFCIHQVDDKKSSLALLFQVVGRGTDWLSKRQPGDSIDILGPLGNGFSILPASRNLLLVGGGIGIAPLPFLAQRAISVGCKVTLLQGASGEWRSENEENPSQLYPKNFLPAEMKFRTITTDKLGLNDMVTDLLPEYINRADQIFACGPSPMYRTMAKMPELKGKSVQVSLEVRMGCGFGLCYGCTIKTKTGLKQICKDGPVFELEEILWDEFVDI
ncbi:MAG: dihydroorotate dehydrogenase electron transfer subunit [Chloroflexota bacterium]